VPTYNRAERITNIIKQIISFQSDEIEIVIGDDASTDGTKDTVKQFKDTRINYYKNKKNLGFDRNLLKIVQRANGEFVFFLMDDDDIEMDMIPWILKTIKENKNLTQLCGSIGNKRPGCNKPYFEFENNFFKGGHESLINLLFYNPHGSGVILRRNVLDLNSAKKYIGFLYLQQVLIAQALITGDTLCSSKCFTYLGKIPYKSGQPLLKGKTYWHALSRLYQNKFKIQIIFDVTKSMKNTRKLLLNKQKRIIYSRLFYLLFRSLRNFYEINDFLEGLKIVISIKEISKSPRFWINFILRCFFELLKRSRFNKYLLQYLSQLNYL